MYILWPLEIKDNVGAYLISRNGVMQTGIRLKRYLVCGSLCIFEPLNDKKEICEQLTLTTQWTYEIVLDTFYLWIWRVAKHNRIEEATVLIQLDAFNSEN